MKFKRLARGKGGRPTQDATYRYQNLDANGEPLGAPRWAAEYRHPVTLKRARTAGHETEKQAKQARDTEIEEAIRAEQARVEEEQAQAAAQAATPVDPFSEVKTTYIAERLALGKLATSYRHLETWEAIFGPREIRSITAAEISAALSDLMVKKPWTPATRNRALSELGGLLSWAYKHEKIDKHPIAGGRVPRLPESKARTRWLRLHEIEALCAACEKPIPKAAPKPRKDGKPAKPPKPWPAAPWLAPLIRFAASTGMRLSEITGLRRGDYQEDDQGRAWVVVAKTKNGTPLEWPLEGWARSYVKEKVDSLPFSGSFIFQGPRGAGAETAIKRMFPDLVRSVGLKSGRSKEGVTFHTLRHSMASLALNAGIPESVVQLMGNWKRPDMVRVYGHLARETIRGAAAQMAKMVTPDFQNKQEERQQAAKQ